EPLICEGNEIELADKLPENRRAVVVSRRSKMTLERFRPPVQVVRQVATVAAVGFAAGAATVVAAKRGRPSIRRGRKRGKGVLGEILSSNSFLVDVHLIKRKK